MSGVLVKRVITSFLLLAVSFLGLTFYFSVWPFSSADAFINEMITSCAGGEVIDPMRHTCGFVDPRKYIIFPIVNIAFFIAGVFMWIPKRVEVSPDLSDPT